MFRQLVLEPVTDTALPAMTVLRSFAEQDNVKLLTATEYNCTVHMFRQLVLKPVTDTAQPAMTELRNKLLTAILLFLMQCYNSIHTVSCQQLYVILPKPTNSVS